MWEQLDLIRRVGRWIRYNAPYSTGASGVVLRLTRLGFAIDLRFIHQTFLDNFFRSSAKLVSIRRLNRRMHDDFDPTVIQRVFFPARHGVVRADDGDRDHGDIFLRRDAKRALFERRHRSINASRAFGKEKYRSTIDEYVPALLQRFHLRPTLHAFQRHVSSQKHRPTDDRDQKVTRL